MNLYTPLALPVAILGALAALTRSALCQTWQTVDDFQSFARAEAYARGVASDDQGNVYVAGHGTDASGVKHGLLMRTGDQGASWSSLLDFNYLPGTNTYFTALTFDSFQNLYLTGAAEAQGEFGTSIQWLVLKSADRGSTWSTVMDFPFYVLSDLPYYGPPYIAADMAGNVYVAHGTFNTTNGWVVRKSSDSGATWTSADNFSGGSTPRGIVCTASGVFVGGAAGVIRRSVDAGRTWATVDGFKYALGSLCADSSGNLFAGGVIGITSGKGAKATTTTYWIFRKSTNSGTTWATVASVPLGVGSSTINSLGSDASGNLYAVGTFGSTWLLLKSTNQGATWTTSDSFQYAAGSSPTPESFGRDPAGNLYVCGVADGSHGGGHWLVRKHSAP